jgi:hypothetical protein
MNKFDTISTTLNINPEQGIAAFVANLIPPAGYTFKEMIRKGKTAKVIYMKNIVVDKDDGDCRIALPPAIKRLPVVAFEYPDSGTSKMRQRYVRVAEATADYIKGNELDDPNSKLDGQFKSFSRTRIVKNGVALVRF